MGYVVAISFLTQSKYTNIFTYDELAYEKEVIDTVPISYLDEIAHQLKVSFHGKY